MNPEKDRGIRERLLDAVRGARHTGVIHLLARDGAAPERDWLGEALVLACALDRPEGVRALLKRGADPRFSLDGEDERRRSRAPPR